MAKSPIEARLHELRRRTWRALALHGCCWLVVVMVALATVAGFLDWLVELTVGVRAVLLVTLLAASLWTAYRYLLVPFLFRFQDVDLALRVESQFPRLNDQLASAVEFLNEPSQSDRSGSAALKHAVVEQATREVSAIDFGEALDWGAARRAMVSAGVVVVVAMGLVFASPASAGIALARLVNPFGRASWPRETHLAIAKAPARLARGEPFPIAVEVIRGRVPDRAEIHYEFEGGEIANEPLNPHGDRQFIGGLESVSRSFDFYVRAGDGLTEPMHVEVVPAPEVELLKVRLTYPDYTGQAIEDLPEDRGQVRAVWGTEVSVTARSSKPLESAELRIGQSDVMPATLSADSLELTASFRLNESGSYWIALRDREGFQNRHASRYDLTMLKDEAPDVFVERPASDIEVTPTAEVPLRVMVKDDYGIQDITLEHSGSAPETTIELPLWSGDDRPKRHVVEYAWQLADLGLTTGSSVTYRVAARDRDDLRGPNVGRSRQLRLIVVSPEELARRLENRQLEIYEELERIRKLQADARSHVTELREQLKHQPTLNKADLARLQAAEMLERQIERKINSPTEGLEARISQIQQDLANNRIANNSVAEQMTALQEGLGQITRDELPQIEQQLGRVRKAAEQTNAESTDAAKTQQDGLAEAQQHQDAVLARLDEMLERLGKWETYRGIARDVRELLEQQEQLTKETGDAGRDTIGKSRDSLSADQQAELAKLAARQDQARDQLGRVQRKMDQMSSRLAESDPVGAEALRDAADGSRQSGTGEQMQKASESIANNQVGAAETAQRQAAEDLKQMLDTLENNRERDLAKIVQKLREAESKLAELRARQSEQLERTQQAQSKQDEAERRRELEKLARQEKELQQETARLAQQLRRLRAEQAGKTSASAAGRMGQVGQQLEQGEGNQAASEQQKVLEELQKAQEQVAEARREAEAELAMEQLAKIGDTLAELHTRQTTMKDETVRLEDTRKEKGNWTRPLLASLRTAAQSQQSIREDTEKAREVLTAAPVFALTLTRAISNMERATERLENRHADADTQAAQQAAIDRFAQLLDALKNEPGGNEESEAGGGGGGGASGGGQPRDGIPPLAQIKLLRSLQIEINERTQELADTAEQTNKLSPGQQSELKSLAAEQGALADLIRDLMQPSEEGENP